MQTAADQMLYMAVKLVTSNADGTTRTGTGFFYKVTTPEGKACLLLVTNKHVIADCDALTAMLHISNGASPVGPSGNFITWDVSISSNAVYGHPDENVDLCAIDITPAFKQSMDAGSPISCVPLTIENIPSEKDWENFDAIEDVIMVGCPNGIFDEANNLPIFRRGTTASALPKRYNGKDEFLVDMACFPGSSGSPVFISSRGYLDRTKNEFMVDTHRFFFLGVLYAGPTITNTGAIILAQPPKFEVASMMHLGFVLRSTHLRRIDEHFRENLLAKYKSRE